MKTSDAFKLIVQIENSVDTNVFTWKNFNTWPLVRQILWFELTSTNQNRDKVKRNSLLFEIFRKIKGLAVVIFNLISTGKTNKNDTKIFISRSVYLQRLPSGQYFDRIMDPIILSLEDRGVISKYYVSRTLKRSQLSIPSLIFKPSYLFLRINEFSVEQQSVIQQISDISDVSAKELLKKYKSNLNIFVQWFNGAKKILNNKINLEEIYLTSWYFPDMMGICAAANELGIKTIDVQHGKQGKYQAMYSGWTKIPEDGYAVMPDRFWCWGQPSCNHILASSPKRRTHTPFIGGYPWINYYKENLTLIDSKISDNTIRVLVTIQPPQGGNTERIPDFIVDFLLSNQIEDINFTFRIHPNDVEGRSYCLNRLSSISPDTYTMDFGKSNLYDAFMTSTHHITAYSSCCYEANVFSVPTLLFGSEAKDIYEDDIKSGIFVWTNGTVSDLKGWLCVEQKPKQKIGSYIEVEN